MSRRSILVLVAALLMVAAACGGSDDGATTTTTTTAAPSTTTTTTRPEAAGIDAVRGSVVQIVGTGTFQDPMAGEQANVPGSGSGFIIDDEGHAVTNNHVVTGAAFLEVYVQGEEAPRNARVVGVSECSDLAVIDIDGDGFPYLEWYDGDITAGLGIFAAGYPLGDPEYTLLEGIVAKERADGETTWASVDAVIEHSADTLPGNSGGPIVTEDGRVVAVNYAGNELGQSFAIGRDVALPMVGLLLEGDAESIGINGEAFFDGVFSGIWVYSVASGSPADDAGVLPGDLITRLEGIELAVDGTMADYCDILRSHTASDVMAIEVYRAATDEVLEGRLNGEPLEVVFSFAAELDGVVVPDDPGAGPTYTEYVNVTNDDATIFVDVPVEWGDLLGIPWDYAGTLVGPALTAAPSVDGFLNTWGTPGVFIAASRELPVTRAELLDSMVFSESCTYLERVPYDDTYYVGEMDIWEACGPEGSTFLVITAEPPEQDYTVLVQIVVVNDADWDAADSIIRTFTVVDPAAG
jgi:serine protease Do